MTTTEFEANTAAIGAELDEAAKAYGTAFEEDGFFGSIDQLGKTIHDFGSAIVGVGDGMGEALEGEAHKAVGSEGFGTSFGGELLEATFSVFGELAEGFSEVGSAIGGAAMEAVGDVVEGVGSGVEHLGDAGSALLDGDLGTAVTETAAGIKDLAVGFGEGAFDIGGGLARAAAEAVEGVASTAWEVGEGAVETVAGLADDLIDGIADLF